jgi:hypothetical protein
MIRLRRLEQDRVRSDLARDEAAFRTGYGSVSARPIVQACITDGWPKWAAQACCTSLSG